MFKNIGTVDVMTEIQSDNGIEQGFFIRWGQLIGWGLAAGALSGAITGTCVAPLYGTAIGAIVGATGGAVGGLLVGPITSGLIGAAADPREALYRSEIVTPIGAAVVFLAVVAYLPIHYDLGALLVCGGLLVTVCVSAAWGGARLVLSSVSPDLGAQIARYEHGFRVSIWLMIASAVIPPLVMWLAVLADGIY